MPFWIIIGVCLAVFVMLVAVAGSFGYLGKGMPPAVQSTPRAALEDGFTTHDVAELRFAQEFRGYRMSQVDAVLERLEQRLSEQDATIAALRSGSYRGDASDTPEA